MADIVDDESKGDIKLLKSTRISVRVDEALPDILVVSFDFGVQLFKGVLLDATKKNLPCGIANVNPAFSNAAAATGGEDALYAVNQRYAYLEPKMGEKRRNVQLSAKSCRSSKMTVRLRPRQVLCSKCKGICNENSENVTMRKRKASQTLASPPQLKRAANAPITRSVVHHQVKQEDTDVLSGNINKLNIDNNKKPALEHSPFNHSQQQQATSKAKKKKEDLWDELDETKRNNNETTSSSTSSTCTRTLKICYGPQGEGTVLKIPAQIENLQVNDGGEEVDLEENMEVDAKDNQKAVRKAMKKAKKEAKRKIIALHTPDCSPKYNIGSSSPRYTVGSASPRHGLGNNSPRYITSTQLEQIITPKKRKHKMKHKKKHKDDKDRKCKIETDSNAMQETSNPAVMQVVADEQQQETQNVPQKLSINLKRLSTTYNNQLVVVEKMEESSSDELTMHEIPNFPPSSNQTLMMVINGPSLKNAQTSDGVVSVGDVVWGKIHGFPWWPGKILTISNSVVGGMTAHVAWYGSATSSLLQCDQICSYLENFKVRYNKKKRGAYKEAIKQATNEAKLLAERKMNEIHSPARNILACVPPALASPREIDVLS